MANEKLLIYADAVLEDFRSRYDTAFMQMHTRDNKEFWNGVCAGVNGCINRLVSSPTVDAVEVVHAHWEDGYAKDNQGNIVYTSIDCSHCNDIFKTDDREYWKKRFKVCPFCGAFMDVKREDGVGDA